MKKKKTKETIIYLKYYDKLKKKFFSKKNFNKNYEI